jgi:lysophospholipase L1-like esterase
MADERVEVKGRGWMAKIAHLAALIWIQIGLTLILFWVVSATAGFVVKQIRRSRDRVPAPRQAYQDTPWAADYFRNLYKVRMRWYPYAYWQGTPMSSRYLNIDPQGNRVTWEKPPQPAAAQRPALKVFMMGGSTMWGTGVRDDYTVASLMAKRLAANSDYRVEVTNFAQIGYVTTQELLRLYELLRQGRRPDLVIFYDGVNDCFTAYQNGIAGLTQSEFFRADEFSVLGSSWGRKKLYRAALHSALMNTGLADLVKLIAGKDNPNTAPHQVKPLKIIDYMAPPIDFEGTDAVERDVVDIYLFNVQMARMLGDRFGFRPLFYWQPTLYNKNLRSPFERELMNDSTPTRQEFYDGTYRRVAAVAAANGIRDISGILRNRAVTDFIDPWHLNETANGIIANKMAADAAPVLAELARQKESAAQHSAAPAAR